MLTRKRLKFVFARLEWTFTEPADVDFDSGSWMRNAYMSLAMSLAISLVTFWSRDG